MTSLSSVGSVVQPSLLHAPGDSKEDTFRLMKEARFIYYRSFITNHYSRSTISLKHLQDYCDSFPFSTSFNLYGQKYL